MAESPSQFRFKDNKLHIFSEEEVLLIAAWPELRAVKKRRKGEAWLKFHPVFRLVRPYRRVAAAAPAAPAPQMEFGFSTEVQQPTAAEREASARKHAFDAFRFALPKEVAATVQPFVAHQWRMLHLFRERIEAIELAEQNPALCFCLANVDIFRRGSTVRSFQKAVEMSAKKQREILDWLHFPSTPAAARILAKTMPESAHAQSLLRLRSALAAEENIKLLSHLPRINAGVIALVSDVELARRTSPRLLSEVAEHRDECYRAKTAGLLTDALTLARETGRNLPPHFQTMARLKEVHDECALAALETKGTWRARGRFPRPPLPGTDDIVPLRTAEELEIEGRLQSNCVGTYTQRVVDGEVFIYRVLRPQRATLSIVPGPGGEWAIEQLEISENRNAHPATHDLVKAWLRRFSIAA